jgi:hypothetical protein
MYVAAIRLLLATTLAAFTWQAGEQPAGKSDPNQLSAPFSQSALRALAQMQRWKERTRNDAKATAPAPVLHDYLKSGAYESVRQAQLAATTSGDKHAGDALLNLYSQVNAWSSKLAEARKNLDATNRVDPNAVDQDEDLLKINECGKAFNTMLGTGTFTDIPSCH